jgi:broad specificity phosphatase PhoE
VDKVIAQIHEFQADYRKRVEEGKVDENSIGADVLIISHGHFSRSMYRARSALSSHGENAYMVTQGFIARWTGSPLQTGSVFDVQAGGVNILGYQHHNIDDRGLLYVASLCRAKKNAMFSQIFANSGLNLHVY